MKQKYFQIMFVILFNFFLLVIIAVPIQADDVDVSKFDIKGIKLGMSQEEVLALFPDAIKTTFNNRHRTSNEEKKDIFTYIIITKPEERKGFLDSRFHIESENKQKGITERIKVEFVNARYGQGVIYVEYDLSCAMPLPADVKSSLRAKYGKPDSEYSSPVYQASYANVTTGKRFSIYLEKKGLLLKLKDNYPETLLHKEKELKSGDIKF